MERLNNSSTTARDLRLELLEKITGGFSKEHEIGSGGYGNVYKGVLNGTEIAMKKLHVHLALNDVIFKNECENLLRNGRTVFAEMPDRVLCFEYLQNGSLEKHLYEEHRGLDWCTRYKIIKGICEGLNYLHGLEKPILHLDLKPANILLDENMVPKIADFGLSRLFDGTHTHITKNPIGTTMYMPPEYINECIITKKNDVYSLGVIIIQIMTGREGCSKYWEMSSQQFIELVHQNWKVRVEAEATSMHTSAGEDCKQVKRCIETALNCVKPERQMRPTIGDIIHKLRETETMTHEVPMPCSQESGNASSSHFKTEMVQNWSQEKQRGGQVKDSSNQQREDLQKQSGMQQKDSSNEQPGSLEKEYQEDTKKHAASGYEKDFSEVSMPFSSTTARYLRFELLEKITGGFSKEHEIGSGGFGEVYKGVLNGKEIAVKKFRDHLALDDMIFKNESENLMRVRHQNIVELVGYCDEIRHIFVEHHGRTVRAAKVDRVLCFEYLQNGSLDKHLDEEHCGLHWCTRYKIIKGICEGLNYLHGLEESILHLNLKPSNILLDKDMVPKIAGFALSMLFSGTHTHITKNPVGSQMYMPPEYINECIITKKNDVYSLGVIIIQIMTGREGYSKYWEMSSQQFIELVHQNWKVRVEAEATSMHTSAGEDCKQVKRCIEIALNCVKPERQKRPTIGDIIHELREKQKL